MNRQWEELKETIIEMRDNNGICTQQEVCKFLANYMEILEKQIQEPCEDAISRQAVLDYIDKMPSELTADGRRMIRRRALEEYISDTLSSVKPQEKTGYWIRGHHGFGCSNCHKSIEGKWDDNIDDITGTLFCPNCGAKMVQEK